ncbi:MAG TPA: phosphate ABC transporter permease subunit PstC [Thermoleophilia bacterium]|nr:phosphate ABC transporter permease subunit PstC [Thermoleophilia bacterium]
MFTTRRKLADRIGDPLLWGLAGLASVFGVGLLVWIAITVFQKADPAIVKYGLGFLVSKGWDPVAEHFGALDFIWGTLESSALALIIAAPISIAIALYLTELASHTVRRPIAILVELLAAIPSVILGLWGILVFGPFLNDHLEPALQNVLGWIPLFSGTPSPYGMLNAALILTIMVVPIVSAIAREVFETTPHDLKEAAYALGATRWEMVRMVILPYGRAGVTGAMILGLGRALGEAIAVTQVIGNTPGIHVSLFAPAASLAAQVASEYQGATTRLQASALIYLAAILLVISLIVNIVARLIVRRSAVHP